jgi:hypothetical protein
MTDQLLAPWRKVVTVLGPKLVKLECGHERKLELEQAERVLMRASVPCVACEREGRQ